MVYQLYPFNLNKRSSTFFTFIEDDIFVLFVENSNLVDFISLILFLSWIILIYWINASCFVNGFLITCSSIGIGKCLSFVVLGANVIFLFDWFNCDCWFLWFIWFIWFIWFNLFDLFDFFDLFDLFDFYIDCDLYLNSGFDFDFDFE